MIFERCYANTNFDNDRFVGIKCCNGKFEIHFPLGYPLPQNDADARKDVLLLLEVLAMYKCKDNKSEYSNNVLRFFNKNDIPVLAYIYCIKDYLYNGYYKEIKKEHIVSNRGKILWKDTIKNLRPVVQGSNLIYLNYVVEHMSMEDEALLTEIHKFCVYESFKSLGWLFTNYKPSKPGMRFNPDLFSSILHKKLSNTFNDDNKILFRNLLAIIENCNEDSDANSFIYGTEDFEDVWEKLVFRTFSVDNIKDYYPFTTWNIGSGDIENKEKDGERKGSLLRPDSVMIPSTGKAAKEVYVLDAKYYKFGAYPVQGNLPKSSDINKQITYGEYIYETVLKGNGKVYNAFVLPFDSTNVKWRNKLSDSGNNNMLWIGEAKGSWKANTKEYERIQAVLLDVKYLMKSRVRQNSSEIFKLAELISKKCKDCIGPIV